MVSGGSAHYEIDYIEVTPILLTPRRAQSRSQSVMSYCIAEVGTPSEADAS